jgi:hypothetical protein
MTIDKIDIEWANSGDKVEPTDEKKEAGWVSGAAPDRPTVETFNYLNNRSDVAINRLIEERLNSYCHDATNPQKMMSTGLWDDSWGITSDTMNVIDGGATKEYIDLSIYFSSDNSPRIMALDTSGTQHVDVYDPRTKELLDTSDSLRDDLPSGSSQTWEAESMCTDGEWVYIVFTDTHLSAGSRTYQIQAWRISDWSVKSGWPSTGTALTGTGISSYLVRNATVIIASNTRLAVGCHWISITATSSAAIQIINLSTGAIATSGAGDSATGYTSNQVCGKISSDGTNVFFATSKNTSNVYICSATISNAQIGCGGAGYPLDRGAGFQCQLASCGSKCILSSVCISSDDDNDVLLNSHNDSNAILGEILRGQNSAFTQKSGSVFLINQPKLIIFDGLHAWLLGTINTSTSNYQYALCKIDIAKITMTAIGTNYRSLGDLCSGSFLISPETTRVTTDLVSMIFDGRDIWCVIEPLASQTNSGKIFRLPLALLRS